MTTKTLNEKFEEAFLEGRNRENILVSSQLQLGADGEYFNSNTRALFNFFKKGAASVVVELPSCGHPAHEQVETYVTRTRIREACRKAIEAAGGTVKS